MTLPEFVDPKKKGEIMSVQYRFFSVPVTGAEEAETELNAFLRTVQVITLHRDLVCQENRLPKKGTDHETGQSSV